MIENLRIKFPNAEFKDSDMEIINKCIDGIYTEDDFIYACKKLFDTTKSKTIKIFSKKEIFIKYRNMHRDNFPGWINNISFDDQFSLKECYRELVSRMLLDHEYHQCNHPDILELVQAYHKESIPYWCIRACLLQELNYYIPIKKYKLIEYMNNGNYIKEKCREIYKKNQDFKKRSSDYLKEIGVVK